MRPFLIIAGALCGLLWAQASVQAGTCVMSSPTNRCGPCRLESHCGGTDHTRYCLAQKPRGCGPDAAGVRAQGGSGISRINPSTIQRLLRWEGRIEIRQQQSIRLPGGEEVVLLVATSDELCHAEYEQLLLFFPAQNRMTSVMTAVMGFEVKDLDRDKNPEIVVHHAFLNHGFETGGTLLAQISGRQFRILHAFAESTDNGGNCSDDPDPDMEPCATTEVDVEFRDLIGDEDVDIVETVRRTTSGRPGPTTVTRFRYRNGKVTPL